MSLVTHCTLRFFSGSRPVCCVVPGNFFVSADLVFCLCHCYFSLPTLVSCPCQFLCIFRPGYVVPVNFLVSTNLGMFVLVSADLSMHSPSFFNFSLFSHYSLLYFCKKKSPSLFFRSFIFPYLLLRSSSPSPPLRGSLLLSSLHTTQPFPLLSLAYLIHRITIYIGFQNNNPEAASKHSIQSEQR